jgi:hypothetical protein
VLLVGTLALSAHWLERWRPLPPDRSGSVTFRVTNGADAGVGSLRDAILAADRIASRARITLDVGRIELLTPLPPLVNPDGIVIEAAVPAEIDGSHLAGAVLDIASPNTLVAGIRIQRGGAGVVVRAPRATLRGLAIESTDTGILVGESADALSVGETVLSNNRVGIQLTGETGAATLHGVQFADHRVAAVWIATGDRSTRPLQVQIADSRFLRSAIGLVAINATARVERSKFADHDDAAIHASGGRMYISENQIHQGKGFGIYAERLQSGYITGNEIARNCNGGMLLRDVSNTRVMSNQLYQNGYGAVLMEGPLVSPNYVADNLIADQIGDGLMLIGASPIVSRNQLLRNRKAGVRLSSLRLPSGSLREPTPLLTENVVRDNGFNDPERDLFVVGEGAVATTGADCSWRLGTVSLPARITQAR